MGTHPRLAGLAVSRPGQSRARTRPPLSGLRQTNVPAGPTAARADGRAVAGESIAGKKVRRPRAGGAVLPAPEKTPG